MENKKDTCQKGKILRSLILFTRLIVDWAIDFIFGFIYPSKEIPRLENVKEAFLNLSAVSLAAKIRNKELTSEKVVGAFIERIKEVNSQLNAVVDERYEEALKEAREADLFLQTTSLSKEELERQKPFLGVPFTSKESTAAKGMAFTFGLVSRKGMKATEDAFIVERLKESGGILIAVTNVPELNLWCETRNNVYGQTNNPFDLTKTVGGSSGGESCIITAGGSPMGIGTDIGGSTRMPAYYCGIFGHKPTTGLTSTQGLTFRTGKETHTLVTAGTLTRYAEDIIPFLKVMIGEKASALQLDKKVDMKSIKVFYTDDPGDLRVSPLSPDVIEKIKDAKCLLSSICGPAKKVQLPGFWHCLSLWRYWMSKEPSNFAHDLANREGEVSLWTELPRMLLFSSQFTLPAIMRLMDLKILPPTDAAWAESVTATLQKDLQEILGDNGVLIFPACPTDAPYHYASILRPYNFAYWAIFNVLKFPVTQVPMGLSRRGLPVGLQVVAGLNNDHLCIAVAKELENTFGGWTPPYVIDKENTKL